MPFLLHPFQVVAAMLVEWVRREQEKVIEYVKMENEILREQLGTKRVLLNDDQRRLIAVKGKALGREELEEYSVVAQADTIRRWHHQLVECNRYTNANHDIGRPRTDQEAVELVLRMARENGSWGYKRIEGALHNLEFLICSSTVANILKQHGIEPAPQRQRQLSWKTFIKAHMDVLADIDLLAVFGVFAGLFSSRATLCDRIRDAWSESDVPIEEMPPVSTSATAIDRFPDLEKIEENDISCSMTGIKSPQRTRGPPTPFEVFKSAPPNPFAKAA